MPVDDDDDVDTDDGDDVVLEGDIDVDDVSSSTMGRVV